MAATTDETRERNVANVGDGPKIQTLFNFHRYPSGWSMFFLCIYFPLGVILAVLRLFVGLHLFIASSFLRYSAVGRRILRSMSLILGIVVLEEGEQHGGPSSRVIVSNHVSPFDYIAVSLTRRVALPTSWDIPEILQRALGVINLGLRSGRETLIKNGKNYCGSEMGSRQPLLTFPEGTMTNGEIGVLKFHSWPFSLDASIQPLVIQLRRPGVADVASTTVGSGLLADTFWLLCVPFTVFTLRWLPDMKMEEGETPDSFTRRVEKAIAAAAGLKTTNYTSHDAFEFAKNHLAEKLSRNGRADERVSPHPYDHLAVKVKEIVPQVPLNVILNDLERTSGSIDATIANILEGRVTYKPEIVPASLKSGQKPLPKVSTNDPSSWRALFDARKTELLETQRSKYMERKGYTLH